MICTHEALKSPHILQIWPMIIMFPEQYMQCAGEHQELSIQWWLCETLSSNEGFSSNGTFLVPLKLTPTLVNHAHGSSLHNIHHLSSLWAVDLGRQEQHYQSLFSFPFPLPLSEWVETVQVGPSEAQPAITVGRERKKTLYSLTPPSPSSSRL